MKVILHCMATFIVLIGTLHTEITRADYANTILADNPIGYWRLGEMSGSTAFDATANNLDGTYTSGVTLNQPGALLTDTDTSVLFDGSTGYVDVGIHPSLNQLSNDFTIEAWIKPDNLSGSQNIIDNRTYSLPHGSLFGGYGFGSFGSRLRYTSYGYLDYDTVPGVISSGIWQHVAVVLDATDDAHFYLNGSFVQTVLGSSPASPSLEPINIGRSPIIPGITQKYFDGAINEVAIYDRSLMPNEIEEHYLAATVPEPSTFILSIFGLIGLGFYGRRR